MAVMDEITLATPSSKSRRPSPPTRNTNSNNNNATSTSKPVATTTTMSDQSKTRPRHRTAAASASRTSAAALIAAVDEDEQQLLLAHKNKKKRTAAIKQTTWERRANNSKTKMQSTKEEGSLQQQPQQDHQNSFSSLGRLATESVALSESLRRSLTDPGGNGNSKPPLLLRLPEGSSSLLTILDDSGTEVTPVASNQQQQTAGEDTDSGRAERSAANERVSKSKRMTTAKGKQPKETSWVRKLVVSKQDNDDDNDSPRTRERSVRIRNSGRGSDPSRTEQRTTATTTRSKSERKERTGLSSSSHHESKAKSKSGDPLSSSCHHRRDISRRRDSAESASRRRDSNGSRKERSGGLNSGSSHHTSSRRNSNESTSRRRDSNGSRKERSGSSHHRTVSHRRNSNESPGRRKDYERKDRGLSSSHHESSTGSRKSHSVRKERTMGSKSCRQERTTSTGMSSSTRDYEEQLASNRRKSRSLRKERTTFADTATSGARKKRSDRSKSRSRRSGKRTTIIEEETATNTAVPDNSREDIYARVDKDMPMLGKIRDAVTKVRRAKSRSKRTGKRTTGAHTEEEKPALDIMQVDGVKEQRSKSRSRRTGKRTVLLEEDTVIPSSTGKVPEAKRSKSRSRRDGKRTVALSESHSEESTTQAKIPRDAHGKRDEDDLRARDLMKDDSVAVTKVRATRSTTRTDDDKDDGTSSSHRRSSGNKSKHSSSSKNKLADTKTKSKSSRSSKPPRVPSKTSAAPRQGTGTDDIMTSSLSTCSTVNETLGDSLVLEDSSLTEHNIEPCDVKEEEPVAMDTTAHQSNTTATLNRNIPKKRGSDAPRAVQFGDVPQVTVHTYKDKQTTITKWYSKDDLYQLLEFELRINLLEGGKKFSNHCCKRGLESYAEEQNSKLSEHSSDDINEDKHNSKTKAMKLLSHAMFVLALQDYLDNAVSKGVALKSKKDVEASPEEVMRRKCRNRTKEDRKMAYRLGLQDASDAKQIYAADAARDESHQAAMMYASEHQFSTRIGMALGAAEHQLSSRVGFTLGSAMHDGSDEHHHSSKESQMGASVRAARTTMSSFLGVSKRRSHQPQSNAPLPRDESVPEGRLSDTTADCSARNKKANVSLMAKLSSRIKVPKGVNATPVA